MTVDSTTTIDSDVTIDSGVNYGPLVRVGISSSAPRIITVTQLAGENVPYLIDLSGVAVKEWEPNAYVSPFAVIRPTDDNQTGFWYLNGSAAGISGNLEPGWATTAGVVVKDGSLTLTSAVPPGSGADLVASATWTQVTTPTDNSQLTISGEIIGALTAQAFIQGSISGDVYTVLAAVTMVSGAIWEARLIITIL